MLYSVLTFGVTIFLEGYLFESEKIDQQSTGLFLWNNYSFINSRATPPPGAR
jgi:hypothetical protein